MEAYQNIYNDLKKQHKEFLDLWKDTSPATSGDLMIKIKDIERKIKEIENLCPALIQQTNQTDLPAGAVDFANLIDLLDRDPLKYRDRLHNAADKYISILPLIFEQIKKGDILMDTELQKKGYVDDKLFNKIITDADTEFDELYIKKELLVKYNEFPFWKRSLIVSALTISLAGKYNARKANLLIDFIDANEDFVWQKALVGLLLALNGKDKEFANDTAFINRLRNLQTHPKLQYGLIKTALAFEKLEEEKNIIQDLSNALKLNTKFEYFEKPAHWFLPFYKDNLVINESGITEPLKTLLTNDAMWIAPIFKYAFCKKYNKISYWQNKRNIEILENEKRKLKDVYKYELSVYYPNTNFMSAAALEKIYEQTLSEFFFFYTSFSKQQFQNIFNQTNRLEHQSAFNIITSEKTKSEVKARQWYNMGLANAKKGNNDKAIECYQKAIEIKPDKHEAFFNMGIAYSNKSDKDKAIECYQKAIEIKPDFYEAFMSIGFTHLKIGNLDLAEEYLIKSIEFGGVDFGNMNLGHVYLAKQNKELALQTYIKSVNNFKNKEKFFEGFDDDFQYLVQYGITEQQYNEMKEKITTDQQKNKNV